MCHGMPRTGPVLTLVLGDIRGQVEFVKNGKCNRIYCLQCLHKTQCINSNNVLLVYNDYGANK